MGFAMINRQQKQQLLLLAAVTAAVLTLFWAGIIRTEKKLITDSQKRLVELRAKAETDRRTAGRWGEFLADMTSTSNRLQELESSLPAKDVYRWQVRTFLSLRDPSIEIINVEPSKPGELSIPAGLPYRAADFTIKGKAAFHDFGRFLADLENNNVHLRVRKLVLDPAVPDALDMPGANKLFFELELTTLVKAVFP